MYKTYDYVQLKPQAPLNMMDYCISTPNKLVPLAVELTISQLYEKPHLVSVI